MIIFSFSVLVEYVVYVNMILLIKIRCIWFIRLWFSGKLE
jgi:hypothetical protein